MRPGNQLADRVPDGLRRRVLDGQRMGDTGHGPHRRPVEKTRHLTDVERRGHDDDAEVRASEPGLPGQGQTEVGMDASLVELVQHDRGEVREQRILLQARRQDPFRDDEQTGIAGEALLEPDLPSDLAPNRPTLFLRDSRRHGACRHAPWLQQDHGTGRGQRWRHPGALARARRGGEDQRAMTIDLRADVRERRRRWEGARGACRALLLGRP